MSSLNGVITGISSYASQVSSTDVYGLNSDVNKNDSEQVKIDEDKL